MPLSVSAQDIWGRDVWENPMVSEGDADGVARWTGRAPIVEDWHEAATALVPMAMYTADGTPSFADPRHVLSDVLKRFAARDLTPVVATELEFYLCDANAPRPTTLRSPLTGAPMAAEGVLSIDDLDHVEGFLTDLYRAAEVAGIPLDAGIAEGGPGQFEVNFRHTADALRMAEDSLIFKRLVRGTARKHGLAATFMAKPFADFAGSGLHVHCSLVDGAGRNVFDDGSETGAPILGHAIAGLIEALPASTLLFAPHLNSYRRFQTGSHAPTKAAWAYENRLAAIRIPSGPSAARRIEHRVSGADANPYLVLSVILSAILAGLEAGSAPPPPVTGDAYASDAPGIPRRWDAAIDHFAGADVLLGRRFVELYSACKRQERDRFAAKVTDYEFATYLDTA